MAALHSTAQSSSLLPPTTPFDSTQRRALPSNSAYAVLRGRFGYWVQLADMCVALCEQHVLSFTELVDNMARPIGVAGAQYDGAAMWLLAQILFLDDVRNELVADTTKNGSKVVRALERMISLATSAVLELPPTDSPRSLALSGMCLVHNRLATVGDELKPVTTELSKFEYFATVRLRYEEFWEKQRANLVYDALTDDQLFAVSIMSSLRSHAVAESVTAQLSQQRGWERAMSAPVVALLSVRARQRLLGAISTTLENSSLAPPSFGAIETLSRLIVLTPSHTVLTAESSMMKTLMRSAVPLTPNELLHLQVIAELFSERLVRHFARTQDLSRMVGALSIATRRLSAALADDPRPSVAIVTFTTQLLQHAVLRCAHAAALVEQQCMCDMTHLSVATRLLLFLLYDNAWFYRATLDGGRERGIAALRAQAAASCQLPMDESGAYVRQMKSPDRDRVTRELADWGVMAPDQSNAATIFATIVTRNPEQRALFLPAVALKYGDKPMSLSSVRTAFAAVGADESERLTFELVHFVLDKHTSVQSFVQSGNWQAAVNCAAAILNRFAWTERVVAVETVLAALLVRADNDALANGVLLQVLVLSDGVRQCYHSFAQLMFNAPFDNDAALARHLGGGEFAHWHYSTYHERLTSHRFDTPPTYFTHLCSRLSLYVEMALRRFLRGGDFALVLETLRHGAFLLQFHSIPSSLALQLCTVVAERAPPGDANLLELLLRCARVGSFTALSFTDEALGELVGGAATVNYAALPSLSTLDATHARTLVARLAPLFDVTNAQSIDDRVPGSADDERFSLSATSSTTMVTLALGEDAFGPTGVDFLLNATPELRFSSMQSRHASTSRKNDGLRSAVPRVEVFCHEPGPLQVFEEPAAPLQRAVMTAAIEVLVCGRGQAPAAVASVLVDAAVEVGSQRIGAAELVGNIVCVLPLAYCDGAIRAALDVVDAACQLPLSWHARATLLDDSRLALASLFRQQPTPSSATWAGTAARPWMRALHARTFLHTLLRSSGADVNTRALNIAADRCSEQSTMSVLSLYCLLRNVLLWACRADLASRCRLVVGVTRCLAQPAPSLLQANAQNAELEDQLVTAAFDSLHHLVAIANQHVGAAATDLRPAPSAAERERDVAAVRNAVTATRALVRTATSVVVRRCISEVADALSQLSRKPQ